MASIIQSKKREPSIIAPLEKQPSEYFFHNFLNDLNLAAYIEQPGIDRDNTAVGGEE